MLEGRIETPDGTVYAWHWDEHRRALVVLLVGYDAQKNDGVVLIQPRADNSFAVIPRPRQPHPSEQTPGDTDR